MPSYEDVTQRAGSWRALTGLTAAEFQALRPHFEQALVTSMRARTIDGQPRTTRRYSPSGPCPLLTMADKLLFMLTSVQPHPMQEGQGQLWGMSQSTANNWIHLLHPVSNHALADQERLPARTADALAARLATPPLAGSSPAPLLGTMEPNARFSARKIPRRSKSMTVARKSVTRSQTSS
jgi:hypothetical protein